MNIDGNKILAIRNTLKLTQKEMAKKMGIAFQTLSAVENGREIPDSKQRFYEVALREVLSGYPKEDILNDSTAEYLKCEPVLSEKELLLDIFSELKEISKKNEQLNETITQMQKDSVDEKKKNDLLRKQLQLAINVLKDLDIELLEREKSTGTKHDIGKTQ